MRTKVVFVDIRLLPRLPPSAAFSQTTDSRGYNDHVRLQDRAAPAPARCRSCLRMGVFGVNIVTLLTFFGCTCENYLPGSMVCTCIPQPLEVPSPCVLYCCGARTICILFFGTCFIPPTGTRFFCLYVWSPRARIDENELHNVVT